MVTIGQDQKDQKDGVLNMNNLEEMRRFFQTYGDQDANAMPDMFNEIDTTSESYMGVPVNEFGEKLNPTGRAMEGVPPILKKVTTETLSPIERSAPEGIFGFGPVAEEAPQNLIPTNNNNSYGALTKKEQQRLSNKSNNTKKQMSPELLNRIVRMLAT